MEGLLAACAAGRAEQRVDGAASGEVGIVGDARARTVRPGLRTSAGASAAPGLRRGTGASRSPGAANDHGFLAARAAGELAAVGDLGVLDEELHGAVLADDDHVESPPG
jgi:hypothetical protein